jgi:hypothetical protein
MLGRPLFHAQSRAHREARLRRLLEKFAIVLAGAAALYVLLFLLVHVREAMSSTRAESMRDVHDPTCAAAQATGASCAPYRNRAAHN